ncbi:hypothetical protein [Sorangium sp. So ce204]|uniref:hypothetical protein n=1 Tax=Sorangium sp. So ce204 TaxID=3133288 RepID=UPI003F5D6F7F
MTPLRICWLLLGSATLFGCGTKVIHFPGVPQPVEWATFCGDTKNCGLIGGTFATVARDPILTANPVEHIGVIDLHAEHPNDFMYFAKEPCGDVSASTDVDTFSITANGTVDLKNDENNSLRTALQTNLGASFGLGANLDASYKRATNAAFSQSMKFDTTIYALKNRKYLEFQGNPNCHDQALGRAVRRSIAVVKLSGQSQSNIIRIIAADLKGDAAFEQALTTQIGASANFEATVDQQVTQAVQATAPTNQYIIGAGWDP